MKKTVKNILIFILAFTLLTLTVSLSVGAENSETEEENTTFFGEMYDAFAEHSTEVFSGLSLLGSCVLAFTYRNGLLPSIRQGVGGIGAAVSEIKAESEKTKLSQDALCKLLEEKLLCIERAFDEFQKKVKAIAEDEARLDAFDKLLDEQVSLLYDVFMSSSMPEYKKEAIGRRVEKMRAEIEGRRETENEKSVES